MKSLFIVAILLFVFSWAGIFDRPPAERREIEIADSLINALLDQHRRFIDSANAVLDTFQGEVRNDQRDVNLVCIKAHHIDNLQIDRIVELQVVRQEIKMNLSTH